MSSQRDISLDASGSVKYRQEPRCRGSPIGNLSSPLFGTSNALSGNSSFTFGASTAQSNRSVSLRAQFSF